MGCAHSAPNRVEAAAATTSDELARPPTSGLSRQGQPQGAANVLNGNSGPLNVLLVQQADVASSSGAAGDAHAERLRRGSCRNAAQRDAALESSASARADQAAPHAALEPAGAAASVGAPGDTAGATAPTTRDSPPGGTATLTPSSRDADSESPQAAAARSSGASTQPLTSGGLPAPSSVSTGAPRLSPLPRAPQAPQQPQPPNGPEAQLSSPLPVLKDLLARISSLPQPVASDGGRKLVLIVWDIENVRCPGGGKSGGASDPLLAPAKVLGYIKAHFIHEPGRAEYRTVAAVTPNSLAVIHKMYSDFVEQMVPELTLLVASAEEPKRNADVMLRKELYRFVSEHAHIARLNPGQLTVVLISGDEDFLEPVQVALNSGFAVELMHHDQPSWALRNQQGYAREPLLWEDFLKQRSGAVKVNLPYRRR